jgi:hypothetical protein
MVPPGRGQFGCIDLRQLMAADLEKPIASTHIRSESVLRLCMQTCARVCVCVCVCVNVQACVRTCSCSLHAIFHVYVDTSEYSSVSLPHFPRTFVREWNLEYVKNGS